MRVATAWQAMDQQPLRFLVSAWPWRSLLYLLSGILFGGLTLFAIATAFAGAIVLLVAVLGVALLVVLALSGIIVARLERWRLRLVDMDHIPNPHRPPIGPGFREWLTTRLRERVTWRELGFALLIATTLCWLDLIVLAFTFVLPILMFAAAADDPSAWPGVILGVIVLASAPYSVTCWAGARASLTRTILGPRDSELGAELTDISQSRKRLLGAFEAERARIERDLHDGAQQRLVAIGMALGLASLDAPDGSPLARRLVDIQEQLGRAQAELRELVRGLSPQVLADNGLVAALEDHAGRFPLPVTVDVRLPRRLPSDVESTAYFVFTEAMANVAKHSSASAATVYGRQHSDTLVLEVSDNGVGGARPDAGTGLSGLAERLTVVHGRLRLSSPHGGPTLLRAEIPCRFE